MNQEARAKLERIMEIQRQMNELEQELSRLLGGERTAAKEPRAAKRGVLATRYGSKERMEQTAAVRSLVMEMAETGNPFTFDGVMQSCNARGIHTTRMQVKQILRHAIQSNRLSEKIDETDGISWYRKPNAYMSGLADDKAGLGIL